MLFVFRTNKGFGRWRERKGECRHPREMNGFHVRRRKREEKTRESLLASYSPETKAVVRIGRKLADGVTETPPSQLLIISETRRHTNRLSIHKEALE